MTLLPKVKLKVVPAFPSNIIGGVGLTATKSNGALTLDYAWQEFGSISAIPASPTSYILTYDTATNAYVMVPSHLLGGAVAGISDAPNDGVQYGRQSAGWTPVAAGGSSVSPATIPPIMDGTAAVGTSLLYARQDHVHPSDTTKITDALSNGTTYGRKDGAWTAISGGGSFDTLSPTTTQGDIIYRNATTNTRLAGGTAGYMLQTNGVANPTWAGFQQNGAGAVTRTWQAKGRDIVSVADFGAVGDFNGTTGTNNAAAFNAALAASTSIYIPPGQYLISSGLTVSNKPMTIVGAGKDASVLVFATGVTPGLNVSQNSGAYPFSMCDLTFTTLADPVTSGCLALNMTWPTGWENRFVNKGQISNVEFRGYDMLLHGWLHGISFTQCQSYDIICCNFTGRMRNGWTAFNQADVTLSANAITWAGGWYPTDLDLYGCNFNFWQFGVVFTGAAEGLQVINCTMVHVGRGVYWFTGSYDPALGGGNAAGRPQLLIADSHFNIFDHALLTDGVVQIQIHDNAFYHSDKAAVAASMIELRHGSDAQIHHNIFRKFSVGQIANAVIIGDATVGFANAVVESNDFGSGFDTGVWFRTDCSASATRLNRFGTVTTPALNQGSGNTIGLNPAAP